MHQSNEASAVLRFGKVIEFDPEKHSARILFPDLDGKISGFIPLLIPNSLQDKHIRYLDEGEHVVCLMSGQGDEAGIILGSFFDAKNEPHIKQGNIHCVKFKDGTIIQYDRDKGCLAIDCVKDILIKAGSHIQLKAPRIDLN